MLTCSDHKTITRLTEMGKCKFPHCPPASATQVHLHHHDPISVQEIPNHVCHHSAVESRPRSDAAASEQHVAVTSVLLAQRETKSHKAQKTTCQTQSKAHKQ